LRPQTFDEIVKFPIERGAGRLTLNAAAGANAGIAEVAGHFDNHAVGHFLAPPQARRKIAAALQIGVDDYGEVTEVPAADMRQMVRDRPFPHGLAGSRSPQGGQA
jgi:hypothetical protein